MAVKFGPVRSVCGQSIKPGLFALWVPVEFESQLNCLNKKAVEPAKEKTKEDL